MHKIIVIIVLLTKLNAFPTELLSNWQNPSWEDLRTVQAYIDGELISTFPNAYGFRTDRVKSFKLFDPDRTSYDVHIEKGIDSSRCVICYCSLNDRYVAGMERLINSLRNSGFSGDIVYRIGGWPNMNCGGIVLCDTPYAFKVSAFEEALRLGYKQALWLDITAVVLSNLNHVFEQIKKNGAYFRNSFFDFAKENIISPTLAEAYQMSWDEIRSIPHRAAGVLGFDLERSDVRALIADWHQLAEQKTPFQSCFPEQVPLSVLVTKYALHQGLCVYEEIVFSEDRIQPNTQIYIKY